MSILSDCGKASKCTHTTHGGWGLLNLQAGNKAAKQGKTACRCFKRTAGQAPAFLQLRNTCEAS